MPSRTCFLGLRILVSAQHDAWETLPKMPSRTCFLGLRILVSAQHDAWETLPKMPSRTCFLGLRRKGAAQHDAWEELPRFRATPSRASFRPALSRASFRAVQAITESDMVSLRGISLRPSAVIITPKCIEMPSRTCFCELRFLITAQHDACTHRLRKYNSATSPVARAALRESELRAGQHDAQKSLFAAHPLPQFGIQVVL